MIFVWFGKNGLAKASFQLSSNEKGTILRIFFLIYDQADCFTKNFGSRSRRPITKKLQNRPIMFGFSHCLVAVHNEATGGRLPLESNWHSHAMLLFIYPKDSHFCVKS